MSEAQTLLNYVSEDVYSRLSANRHVCYLLPDGECLIAFHFCDIQNPLRKDDKVCIYCGKDNFVFITDNEKCAKHLEGIDESIDSKTQLYEFFLSLTDSDVYELEKTEDRITDIEDIILTDERTNTGNSANIIKIRRELLKMKRYYEQLSLITSDLAANTDTEFSVEMQKRFAAADRRMDYLLNSVLHLREYITQVREAYQAEIDIEQNQIMKIFTVITAVFLPLTLIVGWFGMNLQMPEYKWAYGYPYAIALSVVVAILCIIYFKVKKWF
jgi:magnesium transporter